MSDIEEKEALANAAFDAFMAEQGIVIGNEETRALLYEIFIGGMNFMLTQIEKEMKEALA